MPLIIHPSSCCDVCLDTLNYNDKPPFAIPCGHIFCRSCLYDMNPSLCPLCRKPFLPDRSKKLITGEVEVPEVEGVEDKKAIELLLKLVNSLDTGGHDTVILEVDLWLNAGNTHAPLKKGHQVVKEYLLLKSEKTANLRSMRRLQRDMSRLQMDQSAEKEIATTKERELLSRIEKLQEETRKLEERHRAATTITFNHNPLPIPPEPFPIESLPFLANRQQNLSNDNFSQWPWPLYPTTQNTPHPDGVPANTSVERLPATAPRNPSSDQTSMPLPENKPSSNHRSAIIPGASPNQRFVLRSLLEESSTPILADTFGQTTLPVDPFVLATDYFTEYAGGFEEGYRLGQRHLRNHRARRTTEPSAPTSEPLRPLSESDASSSRTLDDRLSHQSTSVSITNHSAHRPLGLRDFYTTPTTNGREDATSGSRASSPRSSSLNSTPTPIHDEQPWVPPEWPVLPMSTSPVSLELQGNSRQSLTPPPMSAPPSGLTWTISSDARPSHVSNSSQARDQRRRSDVPPMGETTPVASDLSSSRRSHLRGVYVSPASSIDSWGTVSSNDSDQITHRPLIFRPAHQVNSVRDLELRLFDDLSTPNSRTISQRSSLFSEAAQSLSSPHVGSEGGSIGSHADDSYNRTPRVVPRSLPATESVSSFEATPPPFVPSQDAERHWDISDTTDSPYHNLDRNHSQRYPAPSGVSETWHRVEADPTSIRSSSHHGHLHSHSVPGPVSTRSTRVRRHRTSRPPVTIYDNAASSRWEANSLVSGAMNALGLTDLAPSTEPHISAPTPITPSRSFLRQYSNES